MTPLVRAGIASVFFLALFTLNPLARLYLPPHVTAPPPPAPALPKELRSRYIRKANHDSVIVFVHGIFGDSISTWTHEASKAYWPQLMEQDDEFKTCDLYVHALPSPPLSASYTIDELVENMRLIFDNDEVFQKHRRVYFLCHSMGGLVVRGYLRRYQERAAQVPMIYFFSTPTSGSHITKMAQFLTRNPQVKGMLPMRSAEYLSVLQKDWLAARVSIASYCAYETLDTHGIRIVDEESATHLCNRRLDPINANHIDIVKPTDRGDAPYLAFREAFKEARKAAGPGP